VNILAGSWRRAVSETFLEIPIQLGAGGVTYPFVFFYPNGIPAFLSTATSGIITRAPTCTISQTI
jgi:hypothetical protein